MWVIDRRIFSENNILPLRDQTYPFFGRRDILGEILWICLLPVGTNPYRESPLNPCLRGFQKLKTFIASSRKTFELSLLVQWLQYWIDDSRCDGSNPLKAKIKNLSNNKLKMNKYSTLDYITINTTTRFPSKF